MDMSAFNFGKKMRRSVSPLHAQGKGVLAMRPPAAHCAAGNVWPGRCGAVSPHGLTKASPLFGGRLWLGLGLSGFRLGVGLGVGLGGRWRSLVHTLDFGGFAQVSDIIGLCLACHIGFDLGFDLLEIRRLAVALLLDLD